MTNRTIRIVQLSGVAMIIIVGVLSLFRSQPVWMLGLGLTVILLASWSFWQIARQGDGR